MKIVTIRERFSHMGSYSGYDQFISYLGEDKNIAIESLWRPGYEFSNYKSLEKLFKKLWKGKKFEGASPHYNRKSLAAEKEAVKLAKRIEADIIHLTYAENHYWYLSLETVKKQIQGVKVIATAHQPPSWWRLNADPSYLKSLDALIVLSQHSAEYFEQYLPGKVYFIPHGVDIDFFAPSSPNKKQFRCVFSGQWLRDISYLRKVIELIDDAEPNIFFDIIYPKFRRFNSPELYQIARYPQVSWHSDVSDEELKELYQRARALVLPLIDCTANNAILEGMACGLPIIATEVGGLISYVDKETFAKLSHPSKPEEMMKAILAIYEDDEIYLSMSKQARIYAEQHLDWSVIVKKISLLYQQLMS